MFFPHWNECNCCFSSSGFRFVRTTDLPGLRGSHTPTKPEESPAHLTAGNQCFHSITSHHPAVRPSSPDLCVHPFCRHHYLVTMVSSISPSSPLLTVPLSLPHCLIFSCLRLAKPMLLCNFCLRPENDNLNRNNSV